MRTVVIAGIVLVAAPQVLRAARRGKAAKSLERWRHPPQPGVWPSASVIVAAWCERGTLGACLEKLRNIDYHDYEVIVVAGGADGTFEAASEYARGDPRVTILQQSQASGKNGAMNDGARRASKDVLVFLDADALVAPGWLKGLVAPLARNDAGGIVAASTGKFVPRRRTLVSEAGEMSQVLENEARGRVILQGSGGMAVRRSAFESIGGIPEGRYADDWALSARLDEHGYRPVYALAAFQVAERPATLAEWWTNELRWRRLHLLTLFQVARGELRSPVSAAKALYPYATAWAVLGLAVASVFARVARLRYSGVVEAALAVTTSTALMRELAGAVETAVYTGQVRWLRTMLVIPILTGLSWVASATATLTTGRAKLHYKGPRPIQATAELPADSLAFPATSGGIQAEVLA